MKKLFVLLAFAALWFTACDNPAEGGTDNSDVIGTWADAANTVTLEIGGGSWTFIKSPKSITGDWSRSGNILTFKSDGRYFATGTLTEGKLVLNVDYYYSGYNGLYTLSKKGSEPPPPTGTPLTVKNESSIEITGVIWNNVSFTAGQESIKTGTSVTKNVQPGSGYIYFKQKGNPIAVRTEDLVIVEDGKEKTYLFIANTQVMDVSNTGTREALGTFYTKPWILVKQGDAAIGLYGEYDYKSVLPNTSKDIVFTIENIGGGDLVIETEGGKYVSLEENASGFFSVTQQPLGGTIPPGNSISFTVRFNPTAGGTNYTAALRIKTNSKNAGDFAFRLRGNAYAVGDTGPGGGTVFFADGNSFIECSGELGSYAWAAAGTKARDFRGGGFSDWRLPDRGELDLMYKNLHLQGLGGFGNVAYWSSTWDSGGKVYYQNFSDGSQKNIDVNSYGYGKDHACLVRAVRAF